MPRSARKPRGGELNLASDAEASDAREMEAENVETGRGEEREYRDDVDTFDSYINHSIREHQGHYFDQDYRGAGDYNPYTGVNQEIQFEYEEYSQSPRVDTSFSQQNYSGEVIIIC